MARSRCAAVAAAVADVVARDVVVPVAADAAARDAVVPVVAVVVVAAEARVAAEDKRVVPGGGLRV